MYSTTTDRQKPQSLLSASATLLTWAQQQQQQQQHEHQSSHIHCSSVAKRLEIPLLLSPTAILPWLQHHPSHHKLYFRAPHSSFQVAAIAFSHHDSGPIFTQSVHQRLISILDPCFRHMRFYGGIRFHNTHQQQPSPQWAAYNGYTFILPAVELFSDSESRVYLAANFYPLNGIEPISNALSHINPPTNSMRTCPPSQFIPTAMSVHDLTDFPTWDHSMTKVLSHISSHQYQKIVLARRKQFTFHPNSTPKPIHILSALVYQNSIITESNSSSSFCSTDSSVHSKKSEHSNAYLFCLQLDQHQAFLGCTPERLFKLDDNIVLTEALAGTVRRTSQTNEKEALAELLNEKNMNEHRFVVDYITAAMSRCGFQPNETLAHPQIRRLPRLMHLSTHISARLSPLPQNNNNFSNLPGNNIFQLLSQLHPTPAVCGVPRDTTLQHIADIEAFDRGLFAGPFGWFSANDTSEFCVAIRSVNVHHTSVTAYAGCGIVKGSKSASEWDETELKMSAFTDLLYKNATAGGSVLSSSSITSITSSNVTEEKVDSNALPNGVDKDRNDFQNVHSFDLNMENSAVNGCVSFEQKNNSKSKSSRLNGFHCEANASPAHTEDVKFKGSDDGISNSIESTVLNGDQDQEHESAKSSQKKGSSSENCSSMQDHFDPRRLEEAPNLNILWGCCVVEELCRNGIFMFFVSPGSRSAPLAVGVARNRHARMFVAHDERGAGFMAIGYSRATGRAAAVITSSGTAVANLLPAAVEGHMDELPLIILTADRPPELRDVGANQSIYQQGIFGQYVNWSKDLPCPSEDIPLRNLLSDIDYAVYRSGSNNTKGPCGPVHVNIMFRENLAPDAQPWNTKYVKSISETWINSMVPQTVYGSVGVTMNTPMPKIHEDLETNLVYSLSNVQNGIILLGGGTGAIQNEDDALCIYEISEHLGWPIISDICGGLRLDSTRRGVIEYADVMLSSPLLREKFRPYAVLQFGERVTSKRVKAWIRDASNSINEFLHMLISCGAKRSDEHFTVTHRLEGDVKGVWQALKSHSDVDHMNGHDERVFVSEKGYLMELVDLSISVGRFLDKKISVDEESDADIVLNEVTCSRIISKCIGKGRVKALYVGNSMPIRDLDMFGASQSEGLRCRIVANRGASGIDGVISSGIGFTMGWQTDTTTFLGDMSFIHDLNALHALRDEDVTSIANRITIVVVNNGGGGIFSMLPISKHSKVFTPLFDTPHSQRFDGVCATFGIKYVGVQTVNQLKHALCDEKSGHRVIEVFVACNHEENASLHDSMKKEIVEFVEQTYGKS